MNQDVESMISTTPLTYMFGVEVLGISAPTPINVRQDRRFILFIGRARLCGLPISNQPFLLHSMSMLLRKASAHRMFWTDFHGLRIFSGVHKTRVYRLALKSGGTVTLNRQRAFKTTQVQPISMFAY